MNVRKYAVIALLGLTLPVMAQLTTLIDAVEVSPAVISVPTSPNGRLSFKPCTERCDEDTITVRLTPETRYIVQGQAMDFAEFRREFFNRRSGTDGYALVSYDTEKNTATSVEVSF